MSLSPAARAWSIENILAHVQDRWFERGILAAPSDQAAADWARSNSGNYGCWTGDRRVDCQHDRVHVRYEDGTSGSLTWLEIARAARAGYFQGVLL